MEEYYPDAKLKTVWQTIWGLCFFILYILLVVILLIVYAVTTEKGLLIAVILISIVEIPTAVLIWLWISSYFKSIKYMVSDDFIRIQKGVFWKGLSTIPFEKVQNVEIHQGPIERSFGLGKILIHTAGYSGQPTAEGVVKGIIDFQKFAAALTDKIKLKISSELVRKKETDFISILESIRNELIDIKRILSQK